VPETSNQPRYYRTVSRREKIAAGIAFWVHAVLVTAAIAGCSYSALL
jgi:hypothetical protein